MGFGLVDTLRLRVVVILENLRVRIGPCLVNCKHVVVVCVFQIRSRRRNKKRGRDCIEIVSWVCENGFELKEWERLFDF